jgi:hypothetical protein
MTPSFRRLAASVTTVTVLGACDPAYAFDFTCQTIEPGIVTVSATEAETTGGASVARVFDVQEVRRSPGQLTCEGSAEWTDGRITGLVMDARESGDGVQFALQATDSPRESMAQSPPSSAPPSAWTMPGGRTVDPTTSDCASIRADVVELGHDGETEPELGALVGIVDFTEIAHTDERLDCEGRAVWERQETRLRYGFHIQVDGKGHVYSSTRFNVKTP